VPWVDHFSFAAQGQPWIYPIGGGLFFYAVCAGGDPLRCNGIGERG
jgi:hypothetical protein